ncbi:MAG: D-lyxose/D-mannose family sugar isomerase [FCB group bacterium]|nr:D-lyxose/D-mannose family sugar isomerase [FCB group bacterium]
MMDRVLETTKKLIKRSGIAISEAEWAALELADFGLGNLESEGLEIFLYENNDRYCAKELVMIPHQTCPEHRHPNLKDIAGKRETFRCRYGEVYLYVPGNDQRETMLARLPRGSEDHYTVFNEIVLKPGEQYTLEPGTRHWFQAGPHGAIVSEFSSTSRDEADIFTDPRIQRVPDSDVAAD